MFVDDKQLIITESSLQNPYYRMIMTKYNFMFTLHYRLLGHILANDYITDGFKKKLKLAAVQGRDFPGSCHKFTCVKVN